MHLNLHNIKWWEKKQDMKKDAFHYFKCPFISARVNKVKRHLRKLAKLNHPNTIHHLWLLNSPSTVFPLYFIPPLINPHVTKCQTAPDHMQRACKRRSHYSPVLHRLSSFLFCWLRLNAAFFLCVWGYIRVIFSCLLSRYFNADKLWIDALT